MALATARAIAAGPCLSTSVTARFSKFRCLVTGLFLPNRISQLQVVAFNPLPETGDTAHGVDIDGRISSQLLH